MSFNKKEHLINNIDAIRLAFELAPPTPEQQETFRKYCGFGGLKCILLPCKKEEDAKSWSKSDAPLFPLVQRLYQVIEDGAENDILM